MQQVGRYQIVGELGRGAMGIVYKALDPAIGRTVAIKSIRLRDLTDPSERDRLRERLFREAQSAGILSHPNIVTIYDIMEADGLAYIFMEFVNGPTLEKMLGEPQTPDKESLLSILRQTATALDYAHKKGIVHRDIKPANIMIHEDGSAKIADFGVAKIMSQNMTQAGTMMGTPSYMAPEQIQGTDISGRTDQFALGVITYEILTGNKPFSAEHMPTLLFKIMRDKPISPSRLNPTLHTRVEAIFERALAKSPAQRYDSCSDFVNALAGALNMNPEWIPLPRGASEDMPTVASDPGSVSPVKVSTTMMETLGVLPEPTSDPQPEPVAIPPPSREPRPDAAPSHTLRNLILAAIVVAMIGAGVYSLAKKRSDVPVADTAAPVPEVTAAPEEPATPAPEPPPPIVVESPAPTPPAVLTPPVTAKARPVPAPTEGILALTSTPAGIAVAFDDETAPACTTPCEITLAAGRHTVFLRKPGYRDARRIIEIPRDTMVNVELVEMIGTLSLATNPPGLTVFIDGKEQTQKTPLSVRLPAGSHKVEAVRGNDRQQFNVDITDGAIVSRTLSWQ